MVEWYQYLFCNSWLIGIRFVIYGWINLVFYFANCPLLGCSYIISYAMNLSIIKKGCQTFFFWSTCNIAIGTHKILIRVKSHSCCIFQPNIAYTLTGFSDAADYFRLDTTGISNGAAVVIKQDLRNDLSKPKHLPGMLNQHVNLFHIRIL